MKPNVSKSHNRNKSKLFIWTHYGSGDRAGLAFAIAENETEAKKLVVEESGSEARYWGEVKIKCICKCGYSVEGGE